MLQTLKIKQIHPEVKLPRFAHATDAGVDLYLPEDLQLGPDERKKVPLGIAMALPADTVGLIWEKGSRSSEGLKTFAGVVDEEFRGEVALIVWNTNQTPHNYEAGTPIAQMVVQSVLHPEIVETSELSETVRGSGGFGSTHAVEDGSWVSTVKK